MSVESNLALAQDWVAQIWNLGQLDNLSRFHPPTFHNEGQPSSILDAKAWHTRIRATYPDIRYEINDIFATEDRVALRWTARGTHRGLLWEMIPATGKQIHWSGMHMLRIEHDQIVEIWAVANSVAQLQQMGVRLVPANETTEPTELAKNQTSELSAEALFGEAPEELEQDLAHARAE